MKSFWWLSILILSGCGGDDIQLPNQTLKGQINMQPWIYRSANGYVISANLYRIRFLSELETASGDPCRVPIPALDFVELTFRPRLSSESLPLINPESVSFYHKDGTRLIAISGFLEIFNLAPRSNIMRGYLQAVLDDENTVEGVFEVRFCN